MGLLPRELVFLLEGQYLAILREILVFKRVVQALQNLRNFRSHLRIFQIFLGRNHQMRRIHQNLIRYFKQVVTLFKPPAKLSMSGAKSLTKSVVKSLAKPAAKPLATLTPPAP